jgi:hypothetical protein
VSAKRGHHAGGSPRLLRRERDGELFDLDKRRVVSVSELREDLRAGRRFRAEDRKSGRDCTYAVLGRVLAGGAGGPRAGDPPDTLSSLMLGTVRNVLDRAADDLDGTPGPRRDGGTPRARRRRAGRGRGSSNIGPG